MPITAAQIAQLLHGEVVGDGSLELTGFAPAESARPGDLTFAENEVYFQQAEASAASAILAPPGFGSSGKVLIKVANPRIASARVLPLFFPDVVYPAGIHPTAVVAATAVVDATAHIGPHSVIGDDVRIGAGSVLCGGNYIGAGSQLGAHVRLFPNVVIYHGTIIGNRVRIHSGAVIGADGFGYVFDAGIHRKIPQVGNVIIGDDVEIGSNTSVDRGALGPTIIGNGAKIDNLVQIAHNVVVGDHSVIVSQAGVAGSTRLGKYVVLGGQVGLAGHLKIGDQVTVAAQSGVMNDIPDGQKMLGAPAVPDRQAKRQYIAIQQLPDLIRQVRDLEKKVAELAAGK